MAEPRSSSSRLPNWFNARFVIAVALFVVLLVFLFSTFFIVNQTEQAVILRFGKFERMVGPGLHSKLPFGIEEKLIVPTQVVHTMAFGFRTERPGIVTTYSEAEYPEESEMLTGDLNIIEVEWIIQYRIEDARAYLFGVANKEKTLRDISQSVVNQLVGDRAILAVMGPERTSIETQAQELMNRIFTSYGFGIRVTTVKLQNIVPPKGDVQSAFEDVNKAIQDMNRYINEGKEEYNKEIPKAQGQAKQVVQEAQGYASERVNRAKGDVARFLSVMQEYEKSPDITRSRLYIETIENVFAGSPGSDLIDKRLENFLPIKTLTGGSDSASAAARAGASGGSASGTDASSSPAAGSAKTKPSSAPAAPAEGGAQ